MLLKMQFLYIFITNIVKGTYRRKYYYAYYNSIEISLSLLPILYNI